MDLNFAPSEEKAVGSLHNSNDAFFTTSDTHPVRAPLDPGSPPRRQAKFGCKGVLWTVFIVVSLTGIYFLVKITSFFYRGFSDPWMSLYQDTKAPYRPQDVVRPLVDSNQFFDVVATVWLRTDEDEKQSQMEGSEASYSAFGDADSSVTEETAKEANNGRRRLREKAIFSDTIFTGLRLTDAGVKSVVNLSVPTEVFKARDLYTYDLRASFVLVPTPPSPLDHVSNYSSWIPDSVTFPPARSWPPNYKRTLAEEVVDAYGTFVPLLSFYNVKSRCGYADNSTALGLESEDDEEEEEKEVSYKLTLTTNNQAKSRWDFSKQGWPPLQSHPYIKTKSHVHVANMTKLYNRKAYEAAHKQLKGQAMLQCGTALQSATSSAEFNGLLERDWTSCTRSYQTNGHQEVKIKLTKEDEKTGKTSTEWVYAPYLSVYERDIGPLDLVEVPVNREDCSRRGEEVVQIVPDEEVVHISWNIMFSGAAPEKLVFTDLLHVFPYSYNMTDTEVAHKTKHAEVEVLHGILAGHHYRDHYHPRWQFLLESTTRVLWVVQQFLESHYWLTRSSTVGIATSGSVLLASGNILNAIYHTIIKNSGNKPSPSMLIWNFLRILLFQTASLAMLKAVLRVDFRFSQRSIPVISLAPASHTERASHRKESYPSREVKILIFVGFGILYSFCHYNSIDIIAPRLLQPPSETRVLKFAVWLSIITSLPAIILGQLLQAVMNSQSQRFAGTYKICIVFYIFRLLCDLGATLPLVIGDAPLRRGFSVYALTSLVLALIMVYQALRYPAISPIDEEEDAR